MFSDLPKLFDRNFFVGFLLPALGFLVANISNLIALPAGPVTAFLRSNSVGGLTFIAVAAWFFAILLLALNSSIVRAKEGYGRLNPAKLWASLERSRFNRL